MTRDKYEYMQDGKTEASLRDVHDAVTSLTGIVREMSSQIDDLASVTNDIHDLVAYHENSPGLNGDSAYDLNDDSEE